MNVTHKKRGVIILLVALVVCIAVLLSLVIVNTVNGLESQVPEIVISHGETKISPNGYGFIVAHLKYENGRVETADFIFEVEKGKEDIIKKVETNGLYHVMETAEKGEEVIVTVSCDGNNKVAPVEVKITVG